MCLASSRELSPHPQKRDVHLNHCDTMQHWVCMENKLIYITYDNKRHVLMINICYMETFNFLSIILISTKIYLNILLSHTIAFILSLINVPYTNKWQQDPCLLSSCQFIFPDYYFLPICLFLLTQYRNMHSMHIILMEITFVYDYIEIWQWLFQKHVILF